MSTPELTPHALRVADLPQRRATPFEITPNAAELERLRNELDLIALRKLRFRGELRPLGKTDWELVATLGATVEQACVATLEPVTTRVETDVTRRFLSQYDTPDDPEVEMPEDDETEALGSHIDPGVVMTEALSLSLPLYPRADGTEPVSVQVTEPGKAAMTDDDAKPFAGLAKLRDALGGDEQS